MSKLTDITTAASGKTKAGTIIKSEGGDNTAHFFLIDSGGGGEPPLRMNYDAHLNYFAATKNWPH